MDTRLENLKRPGTFWRLVFNTRATNVRDIESYDFDPGEFDYLALKRGVRFEGSLPSTVRLRLEKKDKPLGDLLGNPLGWTIMSSRLTKHLGPLIEKNVQLIDAPLFERDSDKRVLGFYIVNVLKVVDCVDVQKSVPMYDGTQICGFYELCINVEKTEGANIFKYIIPPDKIDYGVICSYELVKSLEGKGFVGLAFLPCKCRDV